MPSFDFCYRITGNGGEAFWWLDNTGGVPGTVLANYGFNLMPGNAADWASSSSGSLLLSCPFQLNSSESLTVVATLLNAHSSGFYDVGFAVLLSNSKVKAVLFAVRPDGIRNIGDLGAIPGTLFAAPSAGVSTTYATGGPVKALLGGVEYGLVTGPMDCSGKCSCEVRTVYVPGPGTYQLLFGMFTTTNPMPMKPAAMIVKYAGAS